MKTNSSNNLAIIPGSRYLGIAVFHDSDLREWFIKSLQGNTTKDKLEYARKIIRDLIVQFRIDVLASKKLHASRCSANLSKLVSMTKELSKELNIDFIEYSIQAIENNILDGKPNKKRLVDEVALLFPIVFHDYEREKKNKNRYLTRMFEAIALGYVAFRKLDCGNKRSTHHSNT